MPTTGISVEKDGRFTDGAAGATSASSSGKNVCEKCGAVKRRESHPTQKPVALMRWLVTLVAPKGSLVLDPFAGSGTTLLAAREVGCRAIGIEQDAGYCEIARKRLAQLTLPMEGA